MRIGPTCALALLGMACGGNPAAATQRPLGRPFDLGVAETVEVGSDGLLVTLEAVTEDSRCPRGAQCIWEGDAVARIKLAQGSEAAATFDLHTSARFEQEASYRGYRIVLVDLAPYPTVGASIDPARYVARLRVEAGP